MSGSPFKAGCRPAFGLVARISQIGDQRQLWL